MANAVLVIEGLQAAFQKRHRRDKGRADKAWKALVAYGPRLAVDAFAGVHIRRRQFPGPFREHDNLWKIDLPNGFRALYTVLGRPGHGVVVSIEWLGDHKEYDELFGYSTS